MPSRRNTTQKRRNSALSAPNRHLLSALPRNQGTIELVKAPGLPQMGAEPAQLPAQLTQVPAQQGLSQGRVALLQQGQLVGVGQQHLPQQRRVVQALGEGGGRVRRRRARARRRGLRLLLRRRPRDGDAAEIYPGQTWREEQRCRCCRLAAVLEEPG